MNAARTVIIALASALMLSACGSPVSGEPVAAETPKAATVTVPAPPAQQWVHLDEKPVPDSELRLDAAGWQYGARPYPGVQLFQDLGGGNIDGCTAGPLVQDAAGRNGFLTAGHCDVTPGSPVYTYTDPASGARAHLGTYTEADTDPLTTKDSAVVWLDATAAPTPDATMIAGRWPIAGVMPEVDVRQLPMGAPVCIDGAVSHVRCGELVAAMSEITATIGVEGGDSGSAMFLVDASGHATVIGIVKRHSGSAGVAATYAATAMDDHHVKIVPA